jgi:Ankyrin repeat
MDRNIRRNRIIMSKRSNLCSKNKISSVGAKESHHNNNSIRPLHVALELGQNIAKIVKRYPTSVQEKDENNELPLHIAFSFIFEKDCYSERVIKKLIHLYPNALNELDHHGNYPIHLFFRSLRSMDVFAVLIKYNQRTAKEKDNNNELPLNIACRKGHREDIITALARIYPEGLDYPDHKGDYPFDHLVYSENYSDHFYSSIISYNPNSIKHVDRHGNYPLHIACNRVGHSSWSNIVMILLNHFPAATECANHDGNYPLHLSCTCSISFDIPSRLMDMYPNAVEKKNHEGNFPFHLACHQMYCYEDYYISDDGNADHGNADDDNAYHRLNHFVNRSDSVVMKFTITFSDKVYYIL